MAELGSGRLTRRLLGFAAVALLGTSCAAVRTVERAGPEAAVTDYLAAWEAGDRVGQRRLTVSAPVDFDEQHRAFNLALGVIESRFEDVRIERTSDTTAVASFRARHVLRGLGEWTVDAAVPLELHHGSWRVRWSVSVFHPSLRAGDRLERTRTRPDRAAILDALGRPLTAEGEVVAIGINPSRVGDGEEVVAALHRSVEVDPERVRALLVGAGATDAFVPVIELRPDRYRAVRPALEPVRGIFFRKKTARLSPAEGFAAHTLGRVGPVTSEALAQLGPRYQQGDLVGLSGLERAFEELLAGRPGGELRRVADGEGEAEVLHRFEAVEGEALRTTLLPPLQLAADAALDGVGGPAAIVAVDSATGAIVAVSSRPLGGTLHRALTARYPPGSTFKVVTTEALIADGFGADTRMPCPKELRVSGKSFRNFEGEAFPEGTLRTAFAHSCNTAFLQLAAELGPTALADAARRFGFAASYDVGLPAGTPSFPEPRDAVEAAAAAIGQGRVLATPLHMASVAAAAETGVWRPPFLIQTERRDGQSFRLKSGASTALRTLMRAVVTEGSARSAAGHLQGLAGKTGTAEFGAAVPPQTHAWFIGFRDGIAFAVVVEGGGVGGRVAAPLAARFVERWPQSDTSDDR